MNILIAFIPAIFWGIMPITNVKAGGKPINQILGTTMGAFLVSIVIFFITSPGLSSHALLYGILSGASWAFARCYNSRPSRKSASQVQCPSRPVSKLSVLR